MLGGFPLLDNGEPMPFKYRLYTLCMHHVKVA
jgi:hypothetical protein